MARKKATESFIQEADTREATPRIKTEDRDSFTQEPSTRDSSIRAPSTPSTPSTLRAAPRKRKASGVRRAPAPKIAETSSNAVADAITGTFGFIFRFVGDIFGTAVSLIRKPLAVLFSLYLLAVIIAYVYQFAQASIYVALSPLCKIPGVSLLDVPFCDYVPNKARNDRGKGGKGDFPELINLQSNFGSILENSVGSSHMALDLKNSEVAVRDLSTLVRVSELLCREELSARLDDFVQTAKLTSRSLTKFGSRVNGVVDSLLAMDEYALRALERARVAQIEATSDNVIKSWALAPFKPWGRMVEVEKDILTTFVQASSVMDNSIRRLITEAERVLEDLDDLENRLGVIQDMVSMEESIIKEQHNEILAELWTILGGNRKKLSNFATHRSLLMNIAVYRTKALAHVSASLIQLQQMHADLEDLRDRVVAPALLADSGKDIQDIPLEVHIESIRKGIERLNTGRSNAKSIETGYMKKMISMHDEAIKALDTRDSD